MNECEKDIRSCFEAGAAHVVMDFTEGRLASRNDPRNPWTTRNLLPHFIELDNRVFDRFSADQRKNIGVHVCPGGEFNSVHSADVPYEELLKHLFKLNAGYFQMRMRANTTEKQLISWSASTCGTMPMAFRKSLILAAS